MSRYETENYLVKGDHKPWGRHANVGILRQYKEHIYGNVVDIGCNTGGVTYWLSENKNVSAITGVDINNEAKEHFETIMAPTNIPCKFTCINLVEAKLDNEIYDTAISFHTIEHIYPQDIDAFIKNSTFSLKAGGKFLVSIPYMKEYKDEHHRDFYDEKKLSDVICRNGFEVIECTHQSHSFVWTERHLLIGLFVKK
jgi:cyclopropane fatty-acyl-phospholipid synthase-like methyltransferase